VYQVQETEGRKGVFALKTLADNRTADPSAAAQLVREFEVIACLPFHPNVVSYHKLEVTGQIPFIVMDFVRGDRFHGVLGAMDQGRASRVRRVAVQLLEALCHLHENEVVHGDLKPSNIMVESDKGDWRVKVVDFGMARHDSRGLTSIRGGTQAYMSPQQAAGGQSTKQCDMYAVGVILHEALTGRYPSQSVPDELLAETVADPELCRLCQALLSSKPENRPNARAALVLLGHQPKADAPTSTRLQLIGRDAELRQLNRALARVARGQTVALFVMGESGVGKTELIKHFLSTSHVLALCGACYAAESDSFMAMAGPLDRLRHHLDSLPGNEGENMVPSHTGILKEVFPRTLGRSQVVHRLAMKKRAKPSHEQAKKRKRAFRVLREILKRLAERSEKDRKPLVLFIDDFQWADGDSIELLNTVLSGSKPPPLLLLCCCRRWPLNSHKSARGGDRKDQRFPLRIARGYNVLLKSRAVICRRVRVGRHNQQESEAIVRAVITPAPDDLSALATDLFKKTKGNSYLLTRLAHHCRTFPTSAELPTLTDVLRTDLSSLPAGATHLLHVLALVRRPLTLDDAGRAAGLLAEDARTAATALRKARLVREADLMVMDRKHFELYHSLIGREVRKWLTSDETKALHQVIAEVLAESILPGLHAAAGSHFRRAQAKARAAREYLSAADEAYADAAFTPAAHYYREALALTPDSPHGKIYRQLANALAYDGRGSEAALAYLEAANDPALSTEVHDLRQRAAEQYLIGGQVEQGKTLFRQVLAAIDHRPPETPRTQWRRLVWYHIRLWLRGTKIRRRVHPRDVLPERLREIDAYWVAVGLCVIDPLLGALYQTRSLLAALQVGEPYRVSRSLAAHASHLAARGGQSEKTKQFLKQAEVLAQQVQEDPRYAKEEGYKAMGTVELARGITAYLEGQWKEGVRACRAAGKHLRSNRIGWTWELRTARIFAMWALMYSGDLINLSSRWKKLLKDSVERGDLYATTILNGAVMTTIYLAGDMPDKALEDLKVAEDAWPREGGHVQHHSFVIARTNINLYRRDGVAAWETIKKVAKWPNFKYLTLTQQVRIEHLAASGIAAVAAWKQSGNNALLAEAERAAQKLSREQTTRSSAFTQLIQAALALPSDPKKAMQELESAIKSFETADMQLHAAAVRYQLGSLLSRTPATREKGHQLRELAAQHMKGQKVRKPGRLAASIAPGFGG
jgi:serine/threonine protein kinase/tetratricopeptide (TPR) repeat protein